MLSEFDGAFKKGSKGERGIGRFHQIQPILAPPILTPTHVSQHGGMTQFMDAYHEDSSDTFQIDVSIIPKYLLTPSNVYQPNITPNMTNVTQDFNRKTSTRSKGYTYHHGTSFNSTC
jgi:hypothetical protein